MNKKILKKIIEQNATIDELNIHLIDEEKRNLLFFIIDYGTPEQLEKAIQLKGNLTHQDLEGKNLFMYALVKNKYQFLNLLLHYSSPEVFEQYDQHGWSVLMFASHLPLELFKPIYLKNKNVLNKVTLDSWNPLTRAIAFDVEDTVKFMVDEGADISEPLSEGKNALHYSAYWNREAIFKYLVSKGADLKSRDAQGWDSLTFAVYFKNNEIAQFILNKEKSDLQYKDAYDKTVLDYCQEANNNDIFKLLSSNH